MLHDTEIHESLVKNELKHTPSVLPSLSINPGPRRTLLAGERISKGLQQSLFMLQNLQHPLLGNVRPLWALSPAGELSATALLHCSEEISQPMTLPHEVIGGKLTDTGKQPGSWEQFH